MPKYLTTSIIIFFSIASQLAQSQSPAWKDHFKLVQKDIQQIGLVKKKDLPLKIRLFELYCEKLNLMLQYENELTLKSLDQPVDKPLKEIRDQINETNRLLHAVSIELENKVSDKNILGQIFYFKALNNYSQKKHKEFHHNLLKAEEYCQDKEVCYRVYALLADYYYNEKAYVKAIPYYKKTLSKVSDPWLPKNYFNMSWSYLKLEQYDKALENLIKAHQLSHQKEYFAIGKQLNNSVLLFFAYSKKVNQGLSYIINNRMNTFDNLLLFTEYIFEHGNKNDVTKVFTEIEKLELNSIQKLSVFNQKIKYYRNLKFFQALQNEIKLLPALIETNSGINKDPIFKETLMSLISYNGLLQESLKINTKEPFEQKKIKTNYIQDNFKTLRTLDPNESIKYYYYEGETFFLLEEYAAAIPIYLNLLKYASHQKKQNASNEFLEKTFESLFKSLEYVKDDKKSLTMAYGHYLAFYPKSKNANLIYQRLIDLNIDNKKFSSAIKFITLYNKNIPKDIKTQQDLFKKIINLFINARDTVSLKKMRNKMKTKFLSFGDQELSSLNMIISQIHFNIILEQSKTLSLDKTLSLYDKLYDESTNDYELQYNVILKKLSLEEKSNAYDSMIIDLNKAASVFRIAEKSKYQQSLNYYLNRVCQTSTIDICYRLSQQFRSNKIELDDKNKLIEFKAVVALKRFKHAFKLLRTENDQSYLFQNLLINFPNGESQNFANLSKSITPLSYILEQKFWTIYFKSFDFRKLNQFHLSIRLPSIQQKLEKLTREGETGLKSINLSLPTPPTGTQEKQVSFEDFSIFLNNFSQQFKTKIEITDQLLSRSHANYIIQYTDKIISELNKESFKYSKYDPNTADKELNSAIRSETLKLNSLITQMIKKYKMIQQSSIAKTTPHVGANFYSSYPKVPFHHDTTEVLFWESF